MASDLSPVEPKKSKFPIWVVIVIGVGLLMLLALVTVSLVALPMLLQLKGKGGFAAAAPIFEESAWGARQVKEVTLDAPCEFGPGPDVHSQLPAEVQAAIQYMEVYQSQGLPENFLVMVSRIKYIDEVEVDLDGALQGAIFEAGNVVGDVNPQYDSKETEVSGISARMGSYNHKFGKSNFRLQTIVAGSGPNLWQIQVIYEHEQSAKDATRVLKSIEIER